MQLEEVHFNHNPGTATGDAITICLNKSSGAVVAPEWKRSPVKREPAAYARDAITGPVTIKAKFSGGPQNGTVNVRAIDATLPPQQQPGCGGFIAWLIQKLVQAVFGTNSEVLAAPVTFNGTGNSGLISFQLNAPWLTPSAYVSKRHVSWRWQYDQNGTWTDFDTSDHTVYVSLGLPNAPWVQSGDASQLPWATALDQACAWAVLAKTPDDVAAGITRGVNQVPNVTYTPSTLFVDFMTGSYELQAYLAALAGGPFQMNCTDCADAVTTLSNLLGCTLAEGQFGTLNTKVPHVVRRSVGSRGLGALELGLSRDLLAERLLQQYGVGWMSATRYEQCSGHARRAASCEDGVRHGQPGRLQITADRVGTGDSESAGATAPRRLRRRSCCEKNRTRPSNR